MTIHHDKLAYGRLASTREELSEARLSEMVRSLDTGAEKADVFAFIKEQFSVLPDYPFSGDTTSAVFRHAENKKWFALYMAKIPYTKLGLSKGGAADIVNLKAAPFSLGSILKEEGVCPAYHMNKEHWVSVLLDGTADKELLFGLLAGSYDLTL